MEDYHVFSMDSIEGNAKDHGIALHVNDVKWAEKQMWAPDANEKDGKYYLFFPAKDYEGIFRIGVAVSDLPYGPFTPQPNACLLYTSPSPRDMRRSRMPSSA